MGLCSTCQLLPIRSILQLVRAHADRSVDNEFEWFVTDAKDKQPCIRWHDSLAELDDDCPFCQLIFGHLLSSYHYQKNYNDGEGSLWLEAQVGSAILCVYQGNMQPEVRLSGNFGYNTTPDSSVAHYFVRHETMADSLHPHVLQTAAEWTRKCNDEHAACTQSRRFATPLPTRLLDLDSLPKRSDFEGVRGDPRTLLKDTALMLVETTPDSQGKYIALSYCWGQGLPYITTSKNLQKHKQNGGIEYMQLPETLRDAIFITRYLGVRFLWADCLCILQDDKADWEREASRMADVYRNAYLAVGATRASHCGEGFLHPRKAKDRRVVSFADDEGAFDLYFSYDDLTISPGAIGSVVDGSIKMRREEPLLSRVWVLQERVLATRTIHFASYQMQWECSEQILTEDGLYSRCEEISLERIARGLASMKNAPLVKFTSQSQVPKTGWIFNSAWRVWAGLIQDYTSRNMTYQSDKLPALSGVISALQKLTGDTCVAGIWKSWFLRGLLWRLQDPDWDMYVFFPKTPQRAMPWRAPTWSFASLEGVVLYTLLDHDLGRELCAELIDCDVKPKGVNPLGQLTTGFATIKGPIAAVFDVSPELTSEGRQCRVQMTNDRLAEGSVYFDVEVHDACEVFMITPHTGIAIAPVNVAEGTYARVGAVVVYRVSRMNSKDFKRDCSAFMARDESLSASYYPSPLIITLL